MEKTRGKLIVGNFRDGNGQEAQHLPSMTEPLRLRVSPRTIIDCVLHECDCTFSVHNCSQLDSGDLDLVDESFARKEGNYAHLAAAMWQDHAYDETGEKVAIGNVIFGHVLEIHISGVFMFAKIGESSYADQNRLLEDDSQRRAEDAFILASALIGVPVRRGLIVGEYVC